MTDVDAETAASDDRILKTIKRQVHGNLMHLPFGSINIIIYVYNTLIYICSIVYLPYPFSQIELSKKYAAARIKYPVSSLPAVS